MVKSSTYCILRQSWDNSAPDCFSSPKSIFLLLSFITTSLITLISKIRVVLPLRPWNALFVHCNLSDVDLLLMDTRTFNDHFGTANSLKFYVSSLKNCNQISQNERDLADYECVCVCVCLRSHAVSFEMSGLDWFLSPLINSSCTLMLCIENCWMAFSKIKTTNSAFHNLTGDWREVGSWLIASLGDFSFSP